MTFETEIRRWEHQHEIDLKIVMGPVIVLAMGVFIFDGNNIRRTIVLRSDGIACAGTRLPIKLQTTVLLPSIWTPRQIKKVRMLEQGHQDNPFRQGVMIVVLKYSRPRWIALPDPPPPNPLIKVEFDFVRLENIVGHLKTLGIEVCMEPGSADASIV